MLDNATRRLNTTVAAESIRGRSLYPQALAHPSIATVVLTQHARHVIDIVEINPLQPDPTELARHLLHLIVIARRILLEANLVNNLPTVANIRSRTPHPSTRRPKPTR